MATAIAPSVLLQASSFLPGVVVTRSLRFGAPWGSLAHAKAHTHTLSRTRVGGGLTGYPIKRKWHYPRTYCCADFSFYYTKQSAASGREKPHGLLRRSPRSWRSWRWSWWRSNCGSINIICVCLCDTSSSDPLAPSQHLKPHPLTAHLAVAIYGRTPENSTHSCGESSAKGGGWLYANRVPSHCFWMRRAVDGGVTKRRRRRSKDLIAFYIAGKIYNTAGQKQQKRQMATGNSAPTLQ